MAELRFPVSQDSSDEFAPEFGGVVNRAVQRGQLDSTEAEIAREVGRRILLDGVKTFGDARARLDALGEAGRRQIVDAARRSIGLDDLDSEQARSRFRLVSSAPTRLVFRSDGTSYEIDARHPDDISPGLDAQMRPIPSRNERKRAEAEDRRRREKEREQKEQEREEGEALSKVAEHYRDTATCNVLGMRVDGHGQIVQ